MSAAAAKPTPAMSARPRRTAIEWPGSDGSSKSERSQGRAVDQSEHEEGEAERPHARGAPTEASDDRDADDIVEPPGEGERGDRGSPVRGCERERLRTLVRCEELLPPIGFERVAEQGESCCGHEQAGVAARERQGRLGEVAGGEGSDGERES